MGFQEPLYKPYRDCMAEAIGAAFDGTYIGALSTTQSRNWLPAKEAASTLGVSAQRLVAAVLTGKVTGRTVHSGFGHSHTTVPLETVNEIQSGRERYVDATAVRRYLGISRSQFRVLRDANIFKETAKSELPPLVNGGFDFEVVSSSVNRIRENAGPRSAETVAFCELTLRRTTDRTALAALFERIFAGNIQAFIATDETPLADFEFSTSEVRQALSTSRYSLNWTANDVARIAGWKPQCVVHWCKVGLMEAREVKHGKGIGYMVIPAALAKFQSEFVPLVTLAKSRNTTSRKLLSELTSLGIETYGSQAEAGTSRGHLVKLGDLTRVVSHLSDLQSDEPLASK